MVKRPAAATRTAKGQHRFTPVAFTDLPKFIRYPVEGFLPGDFCECTASPAAGLQQRSFEALFGMHRLGHAVPPDAPFHVRIDQGVVGNFNNLTVSNVGQQGAARTAVFVAGYRNGVFGAYRHTELSFYSNEGIY